MSISKKVISIILTIIMLVTTCSAAFPVLATDNSDDDFFDELFVPQEENSDAYIVSEAVEKREENAKHFRMSDGSYIVAQYNTPVHYLNENGEWIDIDNTISEAQATTEQTELFGTDELYSTANGAENVVFAEKSNSNTIVSYEAKDYPISFNYQSAKKSYINVVDNETVLEGDEAFLTLTDITQEVLYEDVFADVDLQYIVSPTGLKENIILKSESAQNSFTVNYNIGELTAEVVDSNTINLIADDEVVYTISAPYMTDANGEKSEAVTLTVEKNKNGKLRLVISAEESWLRAEDRAYPVVVDPIVETERKKESIDAVMIADSTAYKNYNFSEQSETIVGGEKTYGYCRTLTKIELPKLEKGEMVVSAWLNMCNTVLNYSAGYTFDMQVNAHMITSAWDIDTVTWATKPGCESTVLDYDIFENGGYTWRSFDITKAAKAWYDGTANNGIMLKSSVESADIISNGHKAVLWVDRYNSMDEYYPAIMIVYRNNKGLENYWTYTSLSAGGAGAAYINDYTGNLVFATNIISSSNELMPLSVDCVYNGYASDVKYTSGKDGSSLAVPGYGWRLSVQQTLLETEGDLNENYPYVYTDGDGTDHYIYKNTEDDEPVYEDEDGLGLTLTVQKNGSTVTGYTLTDKKDNKLIFNKQGNLIKVENSNGNYNEFVYDSTGKKLQKMIDGAGRQFTVSYLVLSGSESDYIDYITDPYSRKISFTYNSGTLTKLDFEGETLASFTYADSANECSMLTAKDVNGYKLSFEYTATTGGKQVFYVTEYGKNNALGQKLGFRRHKYNTTEIQSAGIDGVYGNGDDLITTYQFDNFGRTITSQLRTKNGTDSVAGVYNYTDNSTTSLKTANKVTSSASMGANVVNLLNGGNCESVSDWTFGNGSAVTAEFGATSSNSYIGNKSVYVKNTAVNSSDSRSYLYQGVTGLKAGGTYTLSAYVKTKNIASAFGGGDSGAHIFLRYVNSEGAPVYSYSKYIDEETSENIDGGWRKISATVTLPDDVSSLRAYLSLKDATGVAYFDCVQLEEGDVANDYNLLTNAGFENYTDNLPDSWSATSNITSSEGISTVKHEGSRSMSIKGEAGKNKFVSQYATVYGNPDDTYILSGWAKADAVEKSDNHEEARFQMTIQVVYNDGNGGTYTEYKTPAKFNAAIHDWQFTAQTFTLKSEDHPEYQPTKIRVVPVYYHQVNTCYFDNIQLIKDVAQSYVYDSEGNIVSVSANAEQKDNMEYDGEDDLKKYTDVLGNETTYNYDSKHNVTNVTAPGGMKSEFAYNEKGQQTASYIKNSGGTLVIKSETEYTDDGAYVENTTDANGYVVTYGYDLLRGVVNSVTNPKNVTTTYGYDIQDRLTSVTLGDTSVSYSYDGNRLESITYGTDTYSFVYDAYGNVVSTKVNGKPLSTNTYKANNGVLESTTYGNGDISSYTYDTYGNLKAVKNSSGATRYSWHYDNSMQVRSHRDAVNTLKYNYSYDAIGRLYLQEILNNSSGEYIGSTQFTYDLRNNVTEIANVIGGRSTVQYYGYSAIEGKPETENYEKDNLPVRYSISDERYIDYTYDSLNRLTGKTLTLASPLSYSYVYKTSQRGSAYTTSLIGRENIGDSFYRYTYDGLGNITNILSGTLSDSDSQSSYRRYTYDALNQLVREDNESSRETYIYVYDNYGNITEKRVYNRFLTEEVPADKLKEVITYSYGTDADSGWKKILKSYNGEAIDYDEIGNPTTYRGATLDWNERQLKSYDKGNTSVTYKYDSDGLRASKTVNGEKTTYQYVSGKLMYEDRNGTDIYYYYDSNGVPTSIKYYEPDGTTYRFYLATNQLGDVIGLYNTSGNMVVRYEYDAWGNILKTTNANGDSLNSLSQKWSDINPFRYRGYYWDAETELYYLQSRYYDAETGRFLNTDELIAGIGGELLGYNTFIYCFNNPISSYDPTGLWSVDWRDVLEKTCEILSGVGVFALGVLAVSSQSPSLAYIGVKTMVTGVTMVYGAVTEKPIVVDLSVSYTDPYGYYKYGATVLVDYKNNNVQLYGHSGKGYGASFGLSYSVGVVNNYNKPQDYSGPFADINGAFNYGFDYCWNPDVPSKEAVSATSITFSNGFSIGGGMDYYSDPISLFEW